MSKSIGNIHVHDGSQCCEGRDNGEMLIESAKRNKTLREQNATLLVALKDVARVLTPTDPSKFSANDERNRISTAQVLVALTLAAAGREGEAEAGHHGGEMKDVDVFVSREGSIWMVRTETEEARTIVVNEAEGNPEWGGAIAYPDYTVGWVLRKLLEAGLTIKGVKS